MTTTTLTDVRTVAVSVSDQDRAVDFYVERLGFDKRMDASLGGGLRWIEVAPPGARVSIAFPGSQRRSRSATSMQHALRHRAKLTMP